MIREIPQHLLSRAENPATQPSPAPDLGRLDLLGRLPIPLRRPFKAGLDRTVANTRERDGTELDCCFLGGAEWYTPFDGLSAAGDAVPGMLVTTLHHDIMQQSLLARYGPASAAPDENLHPACRSAELADPEGVFRLFSVIPFVFLVDAKRLRGRPAPRSWHDLLHPQWEDDIVIGGWRPNERTPYLDYNAYLLLCLQRRFGDDGLAAYAANVKRLQHNIRTATQAGSNSRSVGAIAVLPWLQAELCPRRERTQVVWPKDGALAMPICSLVRPAAEKRLQPLLDYVHGRDLGAILARNCYPPSRADVPGAFPADARLQWPGWEYFRSHDVAAAQKRAASVFFATWYARHEVRACC